MFPLLGPLSKNNSNWYIVACCVLSVLLLSLSKPQKMMISNLIWEVVYSPFYEAGEKVRGLYQVHQHNRQLRHRIAELAVENSLLQEQGRENERLRELLELKTELGFEVIPTEVIARDPHLRLNSLLINTGSASGVRKNLPVIDERSLAGKVMEVFPHHSVVQLLFDPSFEVSVLDQRSRVQGIAAWKSDLVMELKYVPLSEDVQVGDEIVTSGLSGIYPPGLKIGSVTSVSQDQNLLFKKIEVAPLADIRNSEELFVIKTYSR